MEMKSVSTLEEITFSSQVKERCLGEKINDRDALIILYNMTLRTLKTHLSLFKAITGKAPLLRDCMEIKGNEPVSDIVFMNENILLIGISLRDHLELH